MAMATLPRVIDADGHIFEDLAAIGKLMPDAYRPQLRHNPNLFPELDNVHIAGAIVRPAHSTPRSTPRVGPVRRRVNMAAAVLYRRALAFGRLRHIGWARAVARAYNEWLASTYLAKSPRFRGMALIPLQDPADAAAELRYAVQELGMLGAMLPVSGLNGNLGDPHFRPIYEAAEELGCVIAIHGGSYHGLGL